MRDRRAFARESGQGTVEWVGLISLVVAALAAFGAAGIRVPGGGVAVAIAQRIECAAGERSACGSGSSEPQLVRAYGRPLAVDVRRHAPEIDYEAGMTALPVDFRSCRGSVCGNGASAGPVWLSNTGEPAAAFTHVVDCRRGSRRGRRRSVWCSGPLDGNLYIQYWLYYEDSTSLRDVPGPIGYHEDDWESYQVRIGPGGTCDSRASSHHSYNYDGGIAAWPSDSGLFPRSAWGPCTGRTYVSGGSHAGRVHQDGDAAALGGHLRGDAPRPSFARPSRWTPSSHLRLIPIETMDRSDRRTRFAVEPPWRKLVYFDPEWKET
jgi:hypothetical protein